MSQKICCTNAHITMQLSVGVMEPTKDVKYTHTYTHSILLCLADGRKGELDPVLDKIYKRMQVIVA